MRTFSFRSFAPVVLLAMAALPCVSASITITGLQTSGASVSSAPFQLPNGSTPGGMSYFNVLAEAINTPTLSTVALSGTFSCFALNPCSDTFSVFFDATGFGTGFGSSLNVSGDLVGDLGGLTLTATRLVPSPGRAELLGTLGQGFNATSNGITTIVEVIQVGPNQTTTGFPLAILPPRGSLSVPINLLTAVNVIAGSGDFSGVLTLTIQSLSGNLTLPRGTTADLFLTPSANQVPEPTTLGILAGAGALLVYLKRMKK